MRRSSLRTIPRRSVPLLMSLPLALLTFAATAQAETLPVPSPGPPNVPLTAPVGAVVSLPGALMAALVVALFALLIVVATDRAGDRVQGDLAALPASRRAEEGKRKLAA